MSDSLESVERFGEYMGRVFYESFKTAWDSKAAPRWENVDDDLRVAYTFAAGYACGEFRRRMKEDTERAERLRLSRESPETSVDGPTPPTPPG